jgi:hypothetical protein
MKNFRKLGSALALAMFIGAGMVTFSPTLHAQVPGSPQSVKVRCALIQRAIDAATRVGGADSDLVIYLQGLYAEVCAAS